jgi:hypothetical protein
LPENVVTLPVFSDFLKILPAAGLFNKSGGFFRFLIIFAAINAACGAYAMGQFRLIALGA